MSRSLAKIFLSVSEWLFFGLVFLAPLIVLPWTTDIFETNKQAVFVIGVALAASGYMVSMLLERRSLTRPSALTLAPFLILAVTSVSAVLSVAPMTSWIGQGAQEYASVLSLVGFVTLYFLAKSLSRSQQLAERLTLTLFLGAAVAGLAFLPIFFGLKTGVFTNLIGAPHAFAVYLLVMSVWACGLWLTGPQPLGKWGKILLRGSAIIVTSICVLVLLALDSTFLWALTLTGTGVLFGVALLHADSFQEPGRFVPAMGLFTLAAIFLILPAHFPSPFLREVSPNLETTWNVVNGSWNEGSIAFGSGPGTFSLVYPKYTSLAINQSDFWELVFDRGNSYVTTQLAAIGVVGVLAWLFFTIICTVVALKKIVAAETGWRESVPLFAAWFVLVIAAFVYTENFALSMLFWVLSAGVADLRPASRVKVATVQQARARLAMVLATIVVLVSAVTTILLTVPRYAAEVAFAKAVKISAAADTAAATDEAIGLLDKAAARNPWNDMYYRNLAGALLKRISLVSADEAADDNYVQSLIASAIAAANKATDISPNNVANWDVRGLVYRQLVAVVPGAAQPAVDAYERAISLSPTNPRYRVEAARAYLAIADAQNPLLQNSDKDVAAQAQAVKDDALAKAEDHLTTAVALKDDYPVARYYLALLKERQGDLAAAVSDLETVKSQAPNDIGVGLELGLLYLRQGKNELAQAELQRVIALDPSYANAHWYLSVVFEQQNDLPDAIAEVEKVLDTNADNVTVQARLDRLKAGQTSSAIPDPVTPPVTP